MRYLHAVPLLLLLATSTADADQERMGRKAPHYAGKVPATPVTLIRGPMITGRSFSEPGPSRPVLEAIERARPQVEALLDTLIGAVPAAFAASFEDGAPQVYVGSPQGFYAPPRAEDPDATVPRDAVLIRAADAGGAWRRRAAAAAESAGATHVLVVSLELSDYPLLQTNWKGSKAVELAAGHRMQVPWLTSLDTPVEVLQWTGALYRADGRLIRCGAEAFHAVRTPFSASVLELQRAMRAADIEEALAAPRESLAGTPDAWRVALANLVAELTGRPRWEGSSPDSR